jgi:hypothetical protein
VEIGQIAIHTPGLNDGKKPDKTRQAKQMQGGQVLGTNECDPCAI